jgi:hypothetical protein
LADGGKRGPTTRAERQTMCASATRVEDLVGIATVALSKGGSVDPAVATQILTGLPSLSEFVTSVKQVSCRRD